MSLHSRAFCPRPFRSMLLSVASASILLAAGCTEEAFLNATRPLSDGILLNADDARSSQGLRRDDLGIGFINRTPYRVIGTFGGYDPQDQDTIVTFAQFGVSATLELGPNSVSQVYGMPSTRVFTLGGKRLLKLILDNDLDSQNNTVRTYLTNSLVAGFLANGDLLKEGLGFSGAAWGDDQGLIPTEGTAEPITVFLGQHYRSDSILIFNLVEDATVMGGFRAEFATARDLGVDTERLVQLGPSDRSLLIEPLNLDRMTFNLLAALGNPTLDSPSFSVAGGADPANVEVKITNNTTQALTVSLFGPDNEVLGILPGATREVTVAPGLYEYLVAPTSPTGTVLFNSQQFNAGTEVSLALSGI